MTSGLALGGAGAAGLLRPGRARAQTVVGVTDTEIKIGNTDAYSGPASAYGVIAKAETAFFKMINDQGGIDGRKINFISYDDGYSPPKTVEQVRRLVEEDQVAFLFNTLGTPTNSAIQRYVNQKKVPHLFVSTGAEKWGDPKHFPWTIGYQPSYRTEAQIYTKYLLQQKPNAKLAILYQNDDFGKDYPAGVKDVLGDKFDKVVVRRPTKSPIRRWTARSTRLKASGADVLLTAATPKFAAMTIKKLADIELEADALPDQRFDLGRRGDDAGGRRERRRHHHHRLHEGPDRSGLEGRSGHERVARRSWRNTSPTAT